MRDFSKVFLCTCALLVIFANTANCQLPSCPDGFSGLLPHAYDCTKFFQCDRGATFFMKCGPGTAFNPRTKVCDWPYNVPSCNSGYNDNNHPGGSDYDHQPDGGDYDYPNIDIRFKDDSTMEDTPQ